ncbi:hypothetical protein H311_01055, partial [Anncaliia algerae PRA109]
CRKYYFFYEIEKEESNQSEQQTCQINKEKTTINETELINETKNQAEQSNEKCISSSEVEAKSNEEEIKVKKIIKQKRNLHDIALQDGVQGNEDRCSNDEARTHNENLKPILLKYSEVVKLKKMSNFNPVIPSNHKTQHSQTKKGKPICLRKIPVNATVKTSLTNNTFKKYTPEETVAKSLSGKQDAKKSEMQFSKLKKDYSVEANNSNQITPTNRYEMLEVEEVKQKDEESEGPEEENLSHDDLDTTVLGVNKQLCNSHQKNKKRKKRKTNKNILTIKNDEAIEIYNDADIENQTELSTDLCLRDEANMMRNTEKTNLILYQFKSLRIFYFHHDIEYLKAVLFAKHRELFKDYTKQFYTVSQKREEKLNRKDRVEIEKHVELDSLRSQEFLQTDCKYHFFFYAEDDGVFPNSDFMLLHDVLQDSKDENISSKFIITSESKYIKRYETTKDKLIVFLFYFFQRMQLRNINYLLLKEIVFFFFQFKHSPKILNSSKNFIYTIINFAIEKSEVFNKETNGFDLTVCGNGVDSFDNYQFLMKKFVEFIIKQNLEEMNAIKFLEFLYNIKGVEDIKPESIFMTTENEIEIDKKLILERRNKKEYFE